MRKLIAALALTALLGTGSAQAARLTALGMADTTMVAGGQSLSAMFSGVTDWVQVLAGVHQTKDDVNFGAGGFYKFTVIGTRANGFHVGPGAILGTHGGKFAFSVIGAAGGHFTLFERLMISVDGGPMYVHTDAAKNFLMKPIGDILGLSVHYVF